MRKISAELVSFIDQRLAHSDSAITALDNQDSVSLMLCAAEACVGIKEVGTNAGPIVSLIQSTVGLADPLPWCMSFVQSCIAYAELKTCYVSPIYESEHCLTVWSMSNKARVKGHPFPGDIIIWRSGKTTAGHTGIVSFYSKKSILTVEGNTGPDDNINREGDGVYLKTRPVGNFGKMQLLGFLRPF